MSQESRFRIVTLEDRIAPEALAPFIAGNENPGQQPATRLFPGEAPQDIAIPLRIGDLIYGSANEIPEFRPV